MLDEDCSIFPPSFRSNGCIGFSRFPLNEHVVLRLLDDDSTGDDHTTRLLSHYRMLADLGYRDFPLNCDAILERVVGVLAARASARVRGLQELVSSCLHFKPVRCFEFLGEIGGGGNSSCSGIRVVWECLGTQKCVEIVRVTVCGITCALQILASCSNSYCMKL